MTPGVRVSAVPETASELGSALSEPFRRVASPPLRCVCTQAKLTTANVTTPAVAATTQTRERDMCPPLHRQVPTAVESWSVSFDMGLMFRTVPAVLFARGAC